VRAAPIAAPEKVEPDPPWRRAGRGNSVSAPEVALQVQHLKPVNAADLGFLDRIEFAATGAQEVRS